MENTIKQVEDILKNYDTINAEITNLELEINYWEAIKEGYKGLDYSEGGGNTNKISRPVEDALIKTDIKLQELNFILNEKKLLIDKIEVSMKALTETEQEVIHSKYREGKDWKQIKNNTALSQSMLSKTRNSALGKIAKAVFHK